MIKRKLTLNATFFNLFIAMNCFILVMTVISIGESGASPPSLNHGCSTHCFPPTNANKMEQ